MKNSNAKLWLNIAIVFVALGIGLHSYLTFHFYDLKYGVTASESFCNVNQTFNCDVVSASSFSQFLGVPLALWGAVTNGVLLLFLLFFRFGLVEDERRLARYTLWLSLFVAAMSIVMGIISVTMVASYCLFCLGAYVLSFLTLIAVWQAQEPGAFSKFGSDLADLTKNSRWVAGFLIAIPAAAFLFHNMIQDSRGAAQIEPVIQDSLAVWRNMTPQSFNTNGGLVLGAQTPAMTIVEFADFRCPHCKHASPTLKAFAASHSDVQLIFKPFPLDGSCNPSPNMQSSGDGVSCRLSFATHCAGQLGDKGWKAHDWIFAHQERWTSFGTMDPLLQEMSKELGLDWEKMNTCMGSEETKAAIVESAQQGLDAKISGTPTIFVNGKKLPAGQTLPVLNSAYREIKK